ncbi:hypothetical protein JCM11251_001437 [Rhodosporidiobolus azoricus]
MAPSSPAASPPPRRRLPISISLLTLALFALSSLSEVAVEAKHQPAKRHYDSHQYYVLELDLDRLQQYAPTFSPEDVAAALGAEHVEQVGELKGHYLVRAEKGEVEAGEEGWVPEEITAVPVQGSASGYGQLRKRSPTPHLQEGKRDKILERYDLLRRGSGALSSPPLSLAKRTSSSSSSPSLPIHRLIRSLEPQHPRLRTKRDLPVLPPSSRLLSRNLLPLSRRDPQAAGSDNTGAAPGLIQQMASQFGILDPLWPKQWHLVNDKMKENSINVTGVWDQGIVGKGVNVAIVDDGLDMHSDDLAANFHADGSWDYNDNTPLPEPRLSDDQHGTRCAGEIAAVKNDVCGVGVAHGAGIAGIRILSASISDADEASSLNYGYQTNDIYSCSWGPPDDGRSMEAPGRLIVKAMLNGVQNGRQGKGSIYVFASGNGGAVDDQCNFDGYTNSLMSITVGAIDRKGLHPFYSEACSANMVVTFSSGSGDNIHTTDVGKNTCTDRHGGTSAAAPIAAGIFALVLEARPELTWRDMQHLCVRTAVQVNPNDPDWQLTTAGRPYNHKYGYGKLDAWAIVDAAKRWELVKPQAWWTSPSSAPPGVTEGRGRRITSDGATATLDVSRADLDKANFEKLEHVTIIVFIEHQRRGNIEVELVSPNGMKSVLARPRRFDESDTGMMGWVFMSVKHWDEDPVGTWTLRVRDRQTARNQKVGYFHRFHMQLWGSSIDASLAKPYELAMEYDDPEQEEQEDPVPVAAPVATSSEAGDPTKTYVKPTAHLPDDHAEATGEAHSSFADDGYHHIGTTVTAEDPEPTSTGSTVEDEPDLNDIEYSPPAAATETASTGSSLYDQTPGYLSGLSSLVGSTTWLFVALGVIVVFIAGTGAFFLLRRHARNKSARGGAGGRGGYAFAPATDFEDYDEDEDEDLVPMSAMERGRVRLGGEEGERRGGRTKELFNAFALDSDEEDEDEDDIGGRRASGQATRKTAAIELQEGPFRDEDYDDLDEPRRPLATSAATGSSDTPLTLAEQERRAREEFSD